MYLSGLTALPAPPPSPSPEYGPPVAPDMPWRFRDAPGGVLVVEKRATSYLEPILIGAGLLAAAFIAVELVSKKRKKA